MLSQYLSGGGGLSWITLKFWPWSDDAAVVECTLFHDTGAEISRGSICWCIYDKALLYIQHINMISQKFILSYWYHTTSQFLSYTWLILGLRPANERCHYRVTPSLIGWAQTLNQPWYISYSYHIHYVLLFNSWNITDITSQMECIISYHTTPYIIDIMYCITGIMPLITYVTHLLIC